MSLTRIHNFSISLDGFGTGEGQSLDAPFGHAGQRLHEWMFATRCWHEMVGEPGGTGGVDDAFAAAVRVRASAPRSWAPASSDRPDGSEDPEWKGWWGPNPPFHTPTFVLTHHPRPSIEMEGGTTFHFLDASPAEALETAREAAGGQDVRIGGGPTMSATSSPPGSSTTCTSSWSRSCSAAASASGTGWRASRRTTTSRPPPRPAGSPT